MAAKKYFQINSIVRAFTILDLMVIRDEWELTELVKASGLPKTTVHRILLNLQELGYVDQGFDNHRYTATTKMFERGNAIINKKNVLRIARPIMEDISRQTKETVCLSVQDGIHMIMLDRIDSYNHTFNDTTRVGSRFFTYCSASGKAVLAQLDNDQIYDLFAKHSFEKFTSNTVTSVKDLIKHLNRTRTKGYSIETEEYSLGLRCLGAPIYNHEGKTIASISIAAPLSRLSDKVVIKTVEILLRGANHLSSNMGYIKPA